MVGLECNIAQLIRFARNNSVKNKIRVLFYIACGLTVSGAVICKYREPVRDRKTSDASAYIDDGYLPDWRRYFCQ